jgi:hypothetical protein
MGLLSEFWTSLGYRERPCLKNFENKTKKKDE